MPKHSIITADEFEQEALNHLSTLLSVGMRFTRNATDAEDLVQDTLVKAMRARSGCTGRKHDSCRERFEHTRATARSSAPHSMTPQSTRILYRPDGPQAA